MPSKLYQYPNSDVYVLELSGKISVQTEFDSLEKIKLRVLEDKGIAKLVIHQAPDHLQITSGGFNHALSTAIAVKNREGRATMAGVRNSFKKLLITTKMYDQFSQYTSLEEAIASYE